MVVTHTEGPKFRQKPEMQARSEVVSKPEVEIPVEIPAPILVTQGFVFAIPDSGSMEMPVYKPEAVSTVVFPVRPQTPSITTEKKRETPTVTLVLSAVSST